MRILLLGRDGQLGRAMLQTLTANASPISPDYLSAWGRADLDLSDLPLLRERLNTFRPTLIINAAAYTQVDAAQTQAELTHRINAQVPEVLAHYAHQTGASLMHFSTDYVFAGDRVAGYSEEDACAPINVYGESKYAGELAIEHLFATSRPHPQARYAIFRTSWLYGDGKNFIRTILHLARDCEKLEVTNDQNSVPTNALWLAKVSLNLILGDDLQIRPFSSGIFHAVPNGYVNRYNLARFVVQVALDAGYIMKLSPPDIESISSSNYAMLAKRPLNSYMLTKKFNDTLIKLGDFSKLYFLNQSWEEGVKTYVLDEVRVKFL
jgi:dTDP-4-dehydrorhamnose reductase